MKRLFLILSLLWAVAATEAAPIRELRGAWIATEAGLDWPQRLYEPARQREKLATMLDRLAAANFNTVFVELQGDGTVLWPSSLQPASADITGNPLRPLPYDVTAEVIQLARERGLDVYAVLRPFSLGTRGRALLYDGNPVDHPLLSHPELTVRQGCRYYLDPGNPEVTDYLLQLYTELLAEYPLDGILIDSPLYPSATFDDSDSYSYYNYSSVDPDRWRQNNLNTFVEALADLAYSIRPELRIALAVEGIPAVDDEGRQAVEPSATALAEQGIIDFIVPKLYSRDTYGFTPALEAWTDTPHSAFTIPAITPEKALSHEMARPAPEVEAQVELTRDDPSLAGMVIYRASMVTDTDRPSSAATYRRLRDELFLYPAHSPLLLSRPATMPNSPENLTLERDDRGAYVLTWEAPQPDAEYTPIKYYTVYAARDGYADLSDPRGELAHRVDGLSFVYPGEMPGLEFAVTAFDANGYESAPAFSNPASTLTESERPFIFRFYADNLFISGPKPIARVDIYSMWGNHMKTVLTSDYEVSIPCSDLGGGVYVVHTRYADSSSRVDKFIK